MPRGDLVVPEAEVLLEFPLSDGIHVNAKGGSASRSLVQPFGTDAAEHRLEVPGVDAVELVVAELADVGYLQVRDGNR